MASNRRILKHYVRYSGDGAIIPGGNILSRVKPKVGNWTETDAYECCNGSVAPFTTLDGVWYLSDVYIQPVVNGAICFPDHLNSVAVLNPNLVGQVLPTSSVMLYINSNNFAGDAQPLLAAMAGANGRITLTQGTNIVTYSFTSASISDVGLMIYHDWLYGSNVAGTLNVVDASANDFNTTDPITISIALA